MPCKYGHRSLIEVQQRKLMRVDRNHSPVEFNPYCTNRNNIIRF